MKKSLLLILIFIATLSQAQTKILQATKQPWAGGIAGYTGVNYFVQLSMKVKDSLVIDSIYINGKGYNVVNTNNDTATPHYFKWKENNKPVINLIFKESNFVCTLPVYTPDSLKQQTILPSIPNFKGEALIIYHLNGKRKKLIVQKFTALPQLNYP